jgi:predicted RNA-binding protein with RPS1 domain
MDFVELTKRLFRDLYDSCDRGALQRLGREVERSDGLAPLLEKNSAALDPFPAEHLGQLSEVHREFMKWKSAAKDVRRTLAKSGLQIPDGSLQKTATPDELSALERTARMCGRSGFPDHNSWTEAVQAHLDLWKVCVQVGLNTATVTVTLASPEHPEGDDFATHVRTKTNLHEIRGYQWLGTRRGERARILAVDIHIPEKEIQDQAEVRLSSLGLVAEERGASSVVDELVMNNLASTLLYLTDQRSETEALRTASSAYTGLLQAPPLTVEKMLAVYVSSTTAPAGIALMDNNGELLAQLEHPPDQCLNTELTTWLEKHAPEAAVLPSSSGDGDRLRIALDAVDSIPTVRIHPAAMKEASASLDLPPRVAGAVVLGKRALDPVGEWSKVSPASLGLGEYASEIDPEKIAQTLNEVRLIASWKTSSRTIGINGAKTGRTGGVAKRLNPLVRTIRDLKPGMIVDGVVTNLTKFGAFVNIGLSKEAMIHVSELSDEFVDDPSMVVRIGQPLTARVIEVSPEKNRIALTLKQEAADPFSKKGTPGPVRNGGANMELANAAFEGEPRQNSNSGSKNRSRSEAIADLDALFKKQN